MSMLVPMINETLITVNKYKINGEYHSKRVDLHKSIIYVKLQGKSSEEKDAILLGGGSGAGKTTIIEEYFLLAPIDDSPFVYIDSDDIKTLLPDYKEYRENEDTIYWAAFYVHEESTDIVDMIIHECIERGLSFIYDGTMSWKPHYDELLQQLKINDYRVLGVYVDVDEEVAVERVYNRGLATSRFVDPKIVRRANRNSAITFGKLESDFDEVLMFNNTAERTEDSTIEPFYKRTTVSLADTTFSGMILIEKQFELFNIKSKLPYLE